LHDETILYICGVKHKNMANNHTPISTIFGRTSRMINDALEEAFRQRGLNMSIIEFALLYRLSTMTEDEITQQHFANMEGKHKSVILRQIDGMEQKRWVARMQDSIDKRKNMVSLTKTGISVLTKALTAEKELVSSIAAGIKETDLAVFTKVALQLQTSLATLASPVNVN
jgi:DNA-binding MarR family transcriptional regulator